MLTSCLHYANCELYFVVRKLPKPKNSTKINFHQTQRVIYFFVFQLFPYNLFFLLQLWEKILSIRVGRLNWKCPWNLSQSLVKLLLILFHVHILKWLVINLSTKEISLLFINYDQISHFISRKNMRSIV